MKTIPEYLSGSHDSELRVLVAETRGWIRQPCPDILGFCKWFRPDGTLHKYYKQDFDGPWYESPHPTHRLDEVPFELPPYPTSRDACEELLADLTDPELRRAGLLIIKWRTDYAGSIVAILRATARQICVAYLIVKGVLK